MFAKPGAPSWPAAVSSSIRMGLRLHRRWFFCSVATVVPLLAAWLSAQTFSYYDANGHSQGKIFCDDVECEVTAGSTAIGRVTADGTAYDSEGNRVWQAPDYGRNWRPGNFWVRPELPKHAGPSRDPNGWAVPLEEALRGDAVGGDLDRLQVRALQAAAIAYGQQHKFVSASDADLWRHAAAPHDNDPDANTVTTVVVHDADGNAYVMLRGICVLVIGRQNPAGGSGEVTLWWPGSDEMQEARGSFIEVTRTLAADGIVLASDDSNRVQHIPLRAITSSPLGSANICVSGDPKLRPLVSRAMQEIRNLTLECSDAGNDLVLSVNATGRWIAVLPSDDGSSQFHYRYPHTAFEAVAVLRDRAGQELWWVCKEAWTGDNDRLRVARQIAKALKKFYSARASMPRTPEQNAAVNHASGGEN